MKAGEISLFVGNLPWSVNQADLEAMFSPFPVTYVHLEIGKKGKSRGWGVVRVRSAEAAQTIIDSMNGLAAGQRNLVVRLDEPRCQKKGSPPK